MPAAIRIEELTKDYQVGFWRKRPYRALDRLTLEVQPGEVFGFLGPNGAGKTTTLKLLMQLIFPTSGHAEILGRPVGDVSARQRIGYLPENPSFYDYLTAQELLEYFGHLFGYSLADAPQPRRAAAGAGRHRPGTAPPAAAQVFEGHDPAGRDRAGAAQRPRGGVPRRADVGARSARPPRRALADPGAARSGAHRVLQLAHPRRRGSAVQPGRGGGRGPAGRERPRSATSWRSRSAAGSWWSPISGRRCSPGSDRRSRRRPRSRRTATPSSCRSRRHPSSCSSELIASGATLISLNPLRDTLEDYFVRRVAEVGEGARAAGKAGPDAGH